MNATESNAVASRRSSISIQKALDQGPRLDVAQDTAQRESELAGDLDALTRLGRRFHGLTQRGEILRDRQERLGATELDHDWELKRLRRRFRQCPTQATHRRFGCTTRERVASRGAQSIHRLNITYSLGKQKMRRDPVVRRPILRKQSRRLTMKRRSVRGRDLRRDSLAHDRMHERQLLAGRDNLGVVQAVDRDPRVSQVKRRERGSRAKAGVRTQDRHRLRKLNTLRTETRETHEHACTDRGHTQSFDPTRKLDGRSSALPDQSTGELTQIEGVPARRSVAGSAEFIVGASSEKRPDEFAARLLAQTRAA